VKERWRRGGGEVEETGSNQENIKKAKKIKLPVMHIIFNAFVPGIYQV
jgi:hypothetical protein